MYNFRNLYRFGESIKRALPPAFPVYPVAQRAPYGTAPLFVGPSGIDERS